VKRGREGSERVRGEAWGREGERERGREGERESGRGRKGRDKEGGREGQDRYRRAERAMKGNQP